MAGQSITHKVKNTETDFAGAKPAVSVIVPVYNVELYIQRCVDSLISQTLQNIEIILVNDGSTDACGKICDKYAAKDSRIRVIHQENAGLSEARNAGIDVARADYLMFVDSDDWVEREFCEIPFTKARENSADLVMFHCRYIKNGYGRTVHCPIKEGVITREEALELLIKSIGMPAWNKLYHCDLFQTNCYPKGKVYEDVVLTPVLIHEAKRIAYSSAVLYNQEYRDGSITTVLLEKNARDWFEAHDLTANHLSDLGFSSMAERYRQTSALSFVSKTWNNPEIASKCLNYLRSLKHCPKHFSFKQHCQYYLCIVSPRLYKLVSRVYHFLSP